LQERDLEYLLACSPELKIFGLIESYGVPSRVSISSNSVRCVLIWFSTAEEVAVVTATRLQRLILHCTALELDALAPPLSRFDMLLSSP
jgi:hypothetical protein